MYSFINSWQAIVLVGGQCGRPERWTMFSHSFPGIAIVGPLFARLFSPAFLIILSPFLFLLLLVAFIFSNILISFALDRVSPRTRPQKHLLTAARPFAFSTPAAWEAVLTRSQWSYTSPHSLPPLVPESPHVSTAINEILILIVRDFVLSWYTSLSPSPSFPASVSTTLRASVKELLTRLEKVDLPSLIVRRVIPKINAHVDHFRESERALRGVGLERRVTQSDELDLLLASRYAGRGGKLHPAVDNLSSMLTRPHEEAYIRSLVDRALPFLLPPSETGSRAVHVAAREIISCVVFTPIMDMFAEPDFWNRVIDQFVRPSLVPISIVRLMSIYRLAQRFVNSEYMEHTDQNRRLMLVIGSWCLESVGFWTHSLSLQLAHRQED